jgi:hypothetical protein
VEIGNEHRQDYRVPVPRDGAAPQVPSIRL